MFFNVLFAYLGGFELFLHTMVPVPDIQTQARFYNSTVPKE